MTETFLEDGVFATADRTISDTLGIWENAETRVSTSSCSLVIAISC